MRFIVGTPTALWTKANSTTAYLTNHSLTKSNPYDYKRNKLQEKAIIGQPVG
jgi:hypothetical protein